MPETLIALLLAAASGKATTATDPGDSHSAPTAPEKSPEKLGDKPTEKSPERPTLPPEITTDGLRSYKAAMRELGCEGKQEIGRWANNRVENSQQPFRRRERAMNRFRRMRPYRSSARSTLRSTIFQPGPPAHQPGNLQGATLGSVHRMAVGHGLAPA